jgi:hypothetical protein
MKQVQSPALLPKGRSKELRYSRKAGLKTCATPERQV